MGTFTDPRDGKTYKTVTIGKQTWMAENLNYEAAGSKVYDNNPANAQKYGRLYNWETAKKACPPGWHLPSDAEWQELVYFVGGKAVAGKKLKASSGWNYSGNGEDAFGFSALPGGLDYSRISYLWRDRSLQVQAGGGGSGDSFNDVGGKGVWWTATEDNASRAYSRRMYYDEASVGTGTTSDKIDLYSVRCVQD